MDYLPPERPVLIAQASERLLAEYHRPAYHFFGVGMIDDMPFSNGWAIPGAEEERQHLTNLKPGQKILLLKPDPIKPDAATGPSVYIEQHKPCSLASFESFNSLIKSASVAMLTEKQLQSVSEILGARVTDKTMRTQVYVESLGGRQGLNVYFGHPAERKMGRAFLFVSDSHHRLIQEVGYEGAKYGKDRWHEDAEDMLRNIQFTKPKKSPTP